MCFSTLDRISCWVFGSVLLDNSKIPNDCDVLIIYKVEDLDFVTKNSIVLKADFLKTFEIPLHLTRFTYGEAQEKKQLLKSIFQTNTIRLNIFKGL
jgi:hypothetical protein